MSQKRLSMRKIRELLRLKYDLGRSHREIARSLGIAASTVSDYVRRASAAGFSWPLPEGLDDAALEAVLFPAPPPSRVPRPEPNVEEVQAGPALDRTNAGDELLFAETNPPRGLLVKNEGRDRDPVGRFGGDDLPIPAGDSMVFVCLGQGRHLPFVQRSRDDVDSIGGLSFSQRADGGFQVYPYALVQRRFLRRDIGKVVGCSPAVDDLRHDPLLALLSGKYW